MSGSLNEGMCDRFVMPFADFGPPKSSEPAIGNSTVSNAFSDDGEVSFVEGPGLGTKDGGIASAAGSVSAPMALSNASAREPISGAVAGDRMPTV